MATKALKQPDMFLWTGTDKRGVKVKGQTRGNTPALIKADLRKQGIRPLTVKKQNALFKKSAKKKITLHLGCAVAAQVAIAEVIGKDEYHVGARLRFAETGNLKLET